MFLKNLSIYNDNKPIREINFRKGINLIVDESSSANKTDSGNSVGKTTVLRLIDFCLDGKGRNIFVDPEFKGDNLKIKNFLTENNIVISLTLCDDINDELSNRLVIRRNFLNYTKKIQTIDGIKYADKEFTEKLKELIFDTEVEKPSFRQLISKNIRDEKNKLMNTLRVLQPNVTTDATYEILHLFWFGIDISSSKDKLIRDQKLEVKLQSRLRKESSLSQINQALLIINKEIDELTRLKSNFNLNEKFEENLAKLNDVKTQINRETTLISQLQLRKELILESKDDLEKNYATIDTEQIKTLYDRARLLIPGIQRTFEETLVFHNEMIQQKIKFITEELPVLQADITQKKIKINALLKQEKVLSDSLNKAGAIEGLQSIIDNLTSFYEKKGNFEEQKKLWESSNKNLETIKISLEKINSDIDSRDAEIQNRISQFNTYFSDISSRLDGIYSILSADNSTGVYKFKIDNIEGNPGTGSKKSQMASFDLAYIKFADALGIPCLHFILQDQIENVHANQITNLLTEIVEEVNCQYVLPVLRDKLPKDIDISSLEILSLSQNEKLFKIE